MKTTTGEWDDIIGKSRFLFPFEKIWIKDGKHFWPKLPSSKQSDYENIKSCIESMYNCNEIYRNETADNIFNGISFTLCSKKAEISLPRRPVIMFIMKKLLKCL